MAVNSNLLSKVWTLNGVILLITTAGCYGTEYDSIVLTGDDCSTNHSISTHSELSVSAYGSGTIGQDCRVIFYTKDPKAKLYFHFDEDGSGGGRSYIYNGYVSIYFYSIDGESQELLFGYTEGNSSMMYNTADVELDTNKFMVVINGDYAFEWALYFILKTTDGSSSDYPISVACGVFALSLGGTTVLFLISLCIWCCCCRAHDTPEQVAARRRRKMIDQLAKEGYSVTRDYGSITSTTHLVRSDGGMVDIFSQPQGQSPASSTSAMPTRPSEFEPPPSYDSVRAQRQPVVLQAPVGYGHHVHQPYPNTPSVANETAQQVAQVPEGILVEIETSNRPVADAPPPETPSTQSSHQNLIEL